MSNPLASSYGVTQVGKYRLLRRIAAGGMAEVYLATDDSGALWAVKLVLPHLADQPEFLGLFLDEARLASLINHPNVVRVRDMGMENGRLFLAMEFARGQPLSSIQQRLREKGSPLTPQQAAMLVAQSAAGLHAAHEARGRDGKPIEIVHRDVSPQNLLLTEEGAVKVVDFGIAKARNKLVVTQVNTTRGKPWYMSPEQMRGEPLDRRADVFALGAVLFELIHGSRLFEGEVDQVMYKALNEPMPDLGKVHPGAPPEVVAMVKRACARRPDDRFPSAEAFQHELEAWVARSGGAGDLGALVRNFFPRMPSTVAEALGEAPKPAAAPAPVHTVNRPKAPPLKKLEPVEEDEEATANEPLPHAVKSGPRVPVRQAATPSKRPQSAAPAGAPAKAPRNQEGDPNAPRPAPPVAGLVEPFEPSTKVSGLSEEIAAAIALEEALDREVEAAGVTGEGAAPLSLGQSGPPPASPGVAAPLSPAPTPGGPAAAKAAAAQQAAMARAVKPRPVTSRAEPKVEKAAPGKIEVAADLYDEGSIRMDGKALKPPADGPTIEVKPSAKPDAPRPKGVVEVGARASLRSAPTADVPVVQAGGAGGRNKLPLMIGGGIGLVALLGIGALVMSGGEKPADPSRVAGDGSAAPVLPKAADPVKPVVPPEGTAPAGTGSKSLIPVEALTAPPTPTPVAVEPVKVVDAGPVDGARLRLGCAEARNVWVDGEMLQVLCPTELLLAPGAHKVAIAPPGTPAAQLPAINVTARPNELRVMQLNAQGRAGGGVASFAVGKAEDADGKAQRGERGGAIRDYREAILLDPSLAWAHRELGMLIAADDPRAGIFHLETYLALKKKPAEADKARVDEAIAKARKLIPASPY